MGAGGGETGSVGVDDRGKHLMKLPAGARTAIETEVKGSEAKPSHHEVIGAEAEPLDRMTGPDVRLAPSLTASYPIPLLYPTHMRAPGCEDSVSFRPIMYQKR